MLLPAPCLSQPTGPSSLPTFGMATDGLMLRPSKGAPPELGRPYAAMPKSTRVPNVPLAWEGPRCPNPLQIPGPNSHSRALSPAAATRGSRVPEAAVPAQPHHKPHPGRDEPVQSRKRIGKRRPFGAGEKNVCIKGHEAIPQPAPPSPPESPPRRGFASEHSPSGRANITVTQSCFSLSTRTTFSGRAIAHSVVQTAPKCQRQSPDTAPPRRSASAPRQGGSRLTRPSPPHRCNTERAGHAPALRFPTAFRGTQVPKGIAT